MVECECMRFVIQKTAKTYTGWYYGTDGYGRAKDYLCQRGLLKLIERRDNESSYLENGQVVDASKVPAHLDILPTL